MMAQSIGALALVLAIFAGLVWALRRFQEKVVPHKGGQMQVIQRLHLDSKNSVVEIQHGQQHYLLGVGVHGVQKIDAVHPSSPREEQDAA